jgi:glycosyltransferase involved in cell wall biosynthesis
VTVLVAQIGARRHYAVPRALNRRGLLDRLVTDLAAEHVIWRWIKAAIPRAQRPLALEAMLGRRVEDIPVSRITNLPLYALSPARQRRKGEAQTDYWARRNGAFCRAVTRRGFGAARAVYAFNGAALEIFEAAKARGLTTLLDQTAAPWRWNTRMLLEEARRWPGWEDKPREIDVSGRLSEREEREWQFADRIICGSQFAADALLQTGAPCGRSLVVPYSGHAQLASADDAGKRRVDGGLRVLFVGTLQLRKGVQYLADAARLLKGERIHIRLVGPSHLSREAMRRLGVEVEVAGPLPRSEIGRQYAWADVLVLPTLSEGSVNVCHEAMAAGLPVITTANAGSAVRHGDNGLIIPARDAVALADAIVTLAHDGAMRQAMAANSRAAALRGTIDTYARRLEAALAVPTNTNLVHQ